MRKDVRQLAGFWTDYQHSDFSAREIVLIPDAFVDCNQHIEVILGDSQQFSVALAAVAHLSYSAAFKTVGGQDNFEFNIDALIDQQPHKLVTSRVLASSSAAIASSRVTEGKPLRKVSSVSPPSR